MVEGTVTGTPRTETQELVRMKQRGRYETSGNLSWRG